MRRTLLTAMYEMSEWIADRKYAQVQSGPHTFGHCMAPRSRQPLLPKAPEPRV